MAWSKVLAHVLLPLLPQSQSKSGLRLMDMGGGTQPCPKAVPLGSHTTGCPNQELWLYPVLP